MADAPDFELFGYWYSSATYRVRVGLNIKGLQARERLVDLDAGKQLSEEFLKVNPLGAVPALIVGNGIVLTQSVAILEFLDELRPLPPLLPADAYGRARVRSIAAMLTSDTHPLVVPRVRKYLATTAGFNDAALWKWRTHWFGVGLEALERRLAKDTETGRFCHGDQPTMADVCLASIIAVVRVFKVSVPETPTINRIIAACDALEPFQKADPFKQEGAPKT